MMTMQSLNASTEDGHVNRGLTEFVGGCERPGPVGKWDSAEPVT